MEYTNQQEHQAAVSLSESAKSDLRLLRVTDSELPRKILLLVLHCRTRAQSSTSPPTITAFALIRWGVTAIDGIYYTEIAY